MQALLWPQRLASNTAETANDSTQTHAADAVADGLSLHEQLQAVDPVSAEKLHPNDVRKIARSLAVYRATGVRPSELLERSETRSAYRCAVVWLDADSEVLDARLDRRIDTMANAGLLHEVHALRRAIRARGSRMPMDSGSEPCNRVQCTVHARPDGSDAEMEPCSDGVQQAIGFKELIPFCDELASSGLSEVPTELTGALRLSAARCLQTLQLNTKRYVRKQRRWLSVCRQKK